MIAYLIYMLPALILAGFATLYTRLTFNKYARQRAATGMTGAQAAQRLLDSQNITDVSIQEVDGFLSDHYDPTRKTLRLSPDVYRSDSLSAIGVACHEAGHAIQHATRFAPLALRSILVPATQFGSYGSYILMLIGMFTNSLALFRIGALLFGVIVLFSVVTLPVEWDASRRAKALMTSTGIVTLGEKEMAGKVLNAAFLTYVAAAFTALLEFLYHLNRAGLLGRRG